MRCPHPHRWKCTQVAPTEPKTVGEHIKKRRLQLHWMQAQVAEQMGVHWESVKNWERGITEPMARHLPKIVKFLGYVPFGHDGSPGGKTRWLRACAGWTQDELAEAAGCESVTVWRWETNQPFDHRRWHTGLTVLRERLRSIGLAELTDRPETTYCY